MTLQSHKTQEMKDATFEVPKGFKMHEPEFSRPGLGPVNSATADRGGGGLERVGGIRRPCRI